jgi:uncharacterized protein (TIGR02284 family)
MASGTTKDYVSTLNNLIESCKDGEQGFQKAAQDVKSPNLQTLFNEFARQRAKFAGELQVHVAKLGGDPQKGGTVSGAMHRGWMDVKSAVSGKDDHAILEEAERGEDSAVHAYQDALGQDLPADLRAIVELEYQLVQQAHNQIRSLRDGTGEPAGIRDTRASRL